MPNDNHSLVIIIKLKSKEISVQQPYHHFNIQQKIPLHQGEYFFKDLIPQTVLGVVI
jgi:hypothetical protein